MTKPKIAPKKPAQVKSKKVAEIIKTIKKPAGIIKIDIQSKSITKPLKITRKKPTELTTRSALKSAQKADPQPKPTEKKQQKLILEIKPKTLPNKSKTSDIINISESYQETIPQIKQQPKKNNQVPNTKRKSDNSLGKEKNKQLKSETKQKPVQAKLKLPENSEVLIKQCIEKLGTESDQQRIQKYILENYEDVTEFFIYNTLQTLKSSGVLVLNNNIFQINTKPAQPKKKPIDQTEQPVAGEIEKQKKKSNKTKDQKVKKEDDIVEITKNEAKTNEPVHTPKKRKTRSANKNEEKTETDQEKEKENGETTENKEKTEKKEKQSKKENKEIKENIENNEITENNGKQETKQKKQRKETYANQTKVQKDVKTENPELNENQQAGAQPVKNKRGRKPKSQQIVAPIETEKPIEKEEVAQMASQPPANDQIQQSEQVVEEQNQEDQLPGLVVDNQVPEQEAELPQNLTGEEIAPVIEVVQDEIQEKQIEVIDTQINQTKTPQKTPAKSDHNSGHHSSLKKSECSQIQHYSEQNHPDVQARNSEEFN